MQMDEMIKQKLQKTCNPQILEIINESHKHAGHAGDDGSGQTHFKLIIVSDVFEGLSRTERQRFVSNALIECFSKGLHALSFSLLSPVEHNK